jgi:hypothetical protein
MTTNSLLFKNALIAFHRLVGNHDGKSLADALLVILDRAGITAQVCILLFNPVRAIKGKTLGGTFHPRQRLQQPDHDGGAHKAPSRPGY